MQIADALAIRIKNLCSQRGITVNKLATLSGVTQSTVASILNGTSRNPSIGTIKKIANGLGITLSEFLNDSVIENSDTE